MARKDNYTKVPHWLLDTPNNLTNAEFRVLCGIYRLTAGYHRASYKIKNSTLISMTNISKMTSMMKSLKEKEFIDYTRKGSERGIITINSPLTSSKQQSDLRSTTGLPKVNVSRGAKENIKENLKKGYLIDKFIKQYPSDKCDDITDAWNSLSIEHQNLAVNIMPYQNNKWNDPNFDQKYIPKANNYLLKQQFLATEVRGPYEDKLRREKEKLDYGEYLKSAQEDSANQDEIKEILNALKCKNK